MLLNLYTAVLYSMIPVPCVLSGLGLRIWGVENYRLRIKVSTGNMANDLTLVSHYLPADNLNFMGKWVHLILSVPRKALFSVIVMNIIRMFYLRPRNLYRWITLSLNARFVEHLKLVYALRF